MRIIHIADEIRKHHGGALVPTMGALHEGHLALIRRAASTGLPVIVSIFVNPTQFAPGEDFERYPQPIERDLQLAASAGADVVFVPHRDVIYPRNVEIATPPLPAVATQPQLEDRFRPGHLAGVCQVVARFFDLVMPAVAVFGEKDYQQLLTIRAMAPPELSPVKIIAEPTVREADGLAMSSRNAYLDAAQRERALGLSRALRVAADDSVDAEQAMLDVLFEHELQVDYAVVRDAQTLMPLDGLVAPARALIAARVDNIRLIDNCTIDRVI